MHGCTYAALFHVAQQPIMQLQVLLLSVLQNMSTAEESKNICGPHSTRLSPFVSFSKPWCPTTIKNGQWPQKFIKSNMFWHPHWEPCSQWKWLWKWCSFVCFKMWCRQCAWTCGKLPSFKPHNPDLIAMIAASHTATHVAYVTAPFSWVSKCLGFHKLFWSVPIYNCWHVCS